MKGVRGAAAPWPCSGGRNVDVDDVNVDINVDVNADVDIGIHLNINVGFHVVVNSNGDIDVTAILNFWLTVFLAKSTSKRPFRRRSEPETNFARKNFRREAPKILPSPLVCRRSAVARRGPEGREPPPAFVYYPCKGIKTKSQFLPTVRSVGS